MKNMTGRRKQRKKNKNANRLSAVARAIPIMSACALSGCAINEDFGRYHQPQVRTAAGDIVGTIQEHTGLLSRQAAFHIPLTADEQTLRHALAHFRRPVLMTPVVRNPLKTQTFPRHKTGAGFSQEFISRIKADRLWFHRFETALSGVIEHDMQRYEVIAARHDITDNDSRYIRVRLRENRSVALRILQLLDKRVATYDQSIEYSHLQYPEREIRVIAPAMSGFRADIGQFKGRYESYLFESGDKGDFYPEDE